MTLNQIQNRIKVIALAHRQIRTFAKGQVSNFLADHTTKYPAIFLQDTAGGISLSRKQATINYKMFIMDLVHVSADAGENEDEVLSDTLSIAIDMISQLSNPAYNDWKISADNNVEFVVQNDGDMSAGCVVDFSVDIMYKQNRCEIPSDAIDVTPIDNEMKLVYDKVYIATGSEGTTITAADVPEIFGKKILLITREFGPIYRVSSSPESSEYIWDNTTLTLGAQTGENERFLFLYRNY